MMIMVMLILPHNVNITSPMFYNCIELGGVTKILSSIPRIIASGLSTL